jgi:hypothetical protein
MSVVAFSELNLEAFFEMKLEGDAPKGSGDHTPGFHHGLTDATSVLKWKILKRKLLLSMCRIVCRFPELGQTGNPTCGSWMLLLLVTLHVGLSSSSYYVFSSRFVLSHSSCNLCVFIP